MEFDSAYRSAGSLESGHPADHRISRPNGRNRFSLDETFSISLRRWEDRNASRLAGVVTRRVGLHIPRDHHTPRHTNRG